MEGCNIATKKFFGINTMNMIFTTIVFLCYNSCGENNIAAVLSRL